MAISFVSASSTNTNAAGVDITVTAPASLADDDLMVAVCTGQGAPLNDLWQTPAGWSLVDSNNSQTGRDLSTAVFYKLASSEAGNYTFSLDDSTGEERSSGILVLRGTDTVTPIDVTYVEGSHYTHNTNDFTPTPNAITTVTDGAWVIVTSGINTTALTGVAMSGYTLRIDESAVANTFAATKAVVSAGVETPAAWAHTGGAGTEESATFTIAIRPAGASAAVWGYYKNMTFGRHSQ